MTPAVDVYYQGMSALLPEMIIGAGAVVLLLAEAFAGEKGLGRRAGLGAIGILVLALLSSLLVSHEPRTLFMGMVVIDPFAHYFRILSIVAGVLGVAIALRSSEIEERRSGEYYAMFLSLIVGMILMAAASDILMIYIAIELVSLMSYVLAGFRPRDRKSSEAALKYVIYGGAASGVMLFGFSLLYGLTGETQLSVINEKIAAMSFESSRAALHGEQTLVPVALTAGLVLSFAGFAYKIAAVPLHMWSPDVYEGAPTPFTAFLSTGPKAAGFAALIRFFFVGFADQQHFAANHLLEEVTRLPWPQLIIVVSLLTMTLGNFAAIGQSNIKRFLAYSSIAHAGYSLIGVAVFSKSGASYVLLYLAFYVLMNIGSFFAVIWVRERIGSELISDYKGLGYRAPLVALALTVCLFSLTGLPPLAGFIGKFYLFTAALDRGAAYPVIAACAPDMREALSFAGKVQCAVSGGNAFVWLALIGALNSAISLYYYARVVRNMYLQRPDEGAGPIEEDWPAKAILGPIAVALIAGGIYWTPILNACNRAIEFRRPEIAEVRPGPTPSMLQEEPPKTAQAPRAP
jgi:NADH-quinone oxidoreductase subunit N